MRQVARFPDLESCNREAGGDGALEGDAELEWRPRQVGEEREEVGPEPPQWRAANRVCWIVVDRLDHEAVDDLDRGSLRRLGRRVAAAAHRSVRARAGERLGE